MEPLCIIRDLANGIDPDSKVPLDGCEVFDRPSVVRALFAALRALESMQGGRVESGRLRRTVDEQCDADARKNASKPLNAGGPWYAAEDEVLLREFDAGTSVEIIAKNHGRTPVAIAARLVRLGRIENRKQAVNKREVGQANQVFDPSWWGQ